MTALLPYLVKLSIYVASILVAYLVTCLFLGLVGWTGKKLGFWKEEKRPLNLPRHR